MNPPIIPAIDPVPLPAPAWLFHLLLIVCFFVHVLFLNVTLGGTIIGASSALLTRDQAGPGRRAGRLVLGLLPPSISFTVTTGVAPLLFVQVLYAQVFYPATVLLGWIWLGLLALLIAGYYAVYLAKYEVGAARGFSRVWLPVAALCFLTIAALQVLVNVLQLTPGRWWSVAERVGAAFQDPTLLPRYLHFLLGSLAVGGMFLAILALRQARRDADPFHAWLARRSLIWAMAATGLQVVIGFWLLFRLPVDILRALMGGNFHATAHLFVGAGLGVLAMILLMSIHEPLEQRAMVWAAGGCVLLTVATMVTIRDAVRGLYLAPFVSLAALPIRTQTDVLVLFLAVFALGIVALMWMLGRAARERGEAA
jgi:hypothetical protein